MNTFNHTGMEIAVMAGKTIDNKVYSMSDVTSGNEFMVQDVFAAIIIIEVARLKEKGVSMDSSIINIPDFIAPMVFDYNIDMKELDLFLNKFARSKFDIDINTVNEDLSVGVSYIVNGENVEIELVESLKSSGLSVLFKDEEIEFTK